MAFPQPRGLLVFCGRPGHSFCPPGNALPLPRGIYDFYPECDKVRDGKRALTIYIYIN